MQAGPTSSSNRRDMRLDALRGLFLLIMAAVHVPTPLSRLLQEPFGYTSMAEGFVFLGACLAGFVYGKTYQNEGWTAMARRTWARARKIYFVHLGLVIPVALIAWAVGERLMPLANHLHDFLLHPWASLALIPLLLHQPPLFDILPLYVIFLGATPFVLGLARRHGWAVVLSVSALGWVGAQFKLDSWLLGDPAKLLPFRLGSFSLPAWQFLWVSGLAVGYRALQGPILARDQRNGLAPIALGLVLMGLLSRHGLLPQACYPPSLYLGIDKWTLGPIRLMNFAAWMVVLAIYQPRLPALLSPLVLLGRQALGVFAFHVPAAIFATILIEVFAIPSGPQTILGVLIVGLLFPWAVWLESLSRRRTARPVAKGATAPESSSPRPSVWVPGGKETRPDAFT